MGAKSRLRNQRKAVLRKGLARVQEIAPLAERIHEMYGLDEPTVGQLASYGKQMDGLPKGWSDKRKLNELVAQRVVESLLGLREQTTTHLGVKQGKFAEQVFGVLEVPARDKVSKAYNDMAVHFAKRFARSYPGEIPLAVPPRVDLRLRRLKEHLFAEAELADKVAWIKALKKYSLDEIDNKFQSLREHEHEVVRDNAGTILHISLSRYKLDLADTLAAGADAKLKKLKKHRRKVVRDNARNIMNAALDRGDLLLADELARGAYTKLKMLEGHRRKVVRDNARNIMSTALNKGNLDLADELAEGANAKLRNLRRRKHEVVRKNARNIVYAALNKGNLDIVDTLAAGADAKLKELKKHESPTVRRFANGIIYAALNRGDLRYADRLAREYASGNRRKYPGEHKRKRSAL